MKSFSLIKWSLMHDKTILFKVKGLSVRQKLYIIFLKYLTYLKNKIVGFTSGKSYVTIFNKKFFYDDVYGIASLIRVYCEHHVLKKYIKEGSVILDIGAHIGQFNFFCYHYLKAKCVISVEPVLESFELLLKNSMTPEYCHNILLSNTTGVKTFYIPDESSQLSSYVLNRRNKILKEIKCHSTTLDNLVYKINMPFYDLIKIDTEGSEYDVLMGGKNTLKLAKFLLIEMSVDRPSIGNYKKVIEYLEDSGFECVWVSNNMRNVISVDGLFVNKNLYSYKGRL